MKTGFTLIELSITLIIIGLVIGGVLVGQDLINAAMVRAQVAQIEKYQAATNAFRGKYGYLPGDIPNPAASQFGFTARGTCAGTGDGNGLLEGIWAACPASGNNGEFVFGGETGQFWIDLGAANLIEGGFSTPNFITTPVGYGALTPQQLAAYFPKAKINGYVYVSSGGWLLWDDGSSQDGRNYFSISGLVGGGGQPPATMNLTVVQAYNIDKKMDDGYPQSGRVMAIAPSGTTWAASGNIDPIYGEQNVGDHDSNRWGPVTNPADIGDGMAAGPNSCYDGSSGLPEKYSMGQNKGSGINCVLSFQFQ